MPAWLGEKALPGHRLPVVSSHEERGKRTLWASLVRAPIPFVRAPPHDLTTS